MTHRSVWDAFDDSPLQKLLKARGVLAIRDHFNEVPQDLVCRRPPFQ